MQEEKDCVSYPFGTLRDNRCKYCLISVNGYEIRCNGYCNTIAHFVCTIHAQQKIEIKIHPNDFFCLWCSVYKIEENACQQFRNLIAQTEDLSINNDGNFNQNVVTPETSWTTSKISTSGSSKKSNKRSFKSAPTTPTTPVTPMVFFSTTCSPLRPNTCSPIRQASSSSETGLNRSIALSGNSSKNITLEKSSNMPETPLSKSPSKFPTFVSSKNSNENFFELDFPTIPTTPKTEGILLTRSVSPRLPSVRSPRKPRCRPSPQTKTDSYKKDLQPALTQHNVEVNSNLPVLYEILLEIKQCTKLLNERVSYQKTTSSFERDKGNYLKNLNVLMQSNNDTLRIIQTQIHDVQAQCNELRNFSRSILMDNQSTSV
ncbi:hypothetical protein ALC62_07114 [Cyphomyrmex costatus]|uniref:Uncharacterized protein n=1 Tax=Cyphomyrmex costatus TaxID=456900 RepID=A0A195CN35_9HYME|nr:hypothetical protein ALC62_07114 [Cyphomyrmex costatus]